MKSSFNIGDRLRQLRSNRALSQEQVANIADITPAYFGQIERGSKNVTLRNLEKICNALNISLAEFFDVEQPDTYIDGTSAQIFLQLEGMSEAEKQNILRIIKIVRSFKK